MEYQAVEKSALKSCLLRDATPPSFLQSQNQFVTDDVLGGFDAFPVDDLLVDFSNEPEEGYDDYGSGSKDGFGSVSSHEDDYGDRYGTFSSQLAVPDDDLAELEWVSHFVHDSVPDLYPITTLMGRREPAPVALPRFPAHVPVRARSKRPRIARRERHPSLSSDSSSSSSCLSFERGRGRTGSPQQQRRCAHCQVQRTPQWRAGPMGPKTLCNACGVRYKSGRLLPEYRPACSPTFSVENHSNSHRKVLEMRRRKGEVVMAGRRCREELLEV